MVLFMIVLVIVYFLFLALFIRKKAFRSYNDSMKKLDTMNQSLIKHVMDKKILNDRKTDLENETLEIFTLYEITKEITKSLSEEEAFDLFKQKLGEYIAFDECLFFNPNSEKLKDIKKSKKYDLISLQGKRRRIGEIAINGVQEQDKEKLMILVQQFALALRRVKLYEEIERISITDSLTEVYTRNYALERFVEEINRAKKRKDIVSVLMLDVDLFKNLNDTYGHLAGDLILREIAGMIKSSIREIDIAGRYGGEEFVIVLPDTDRTEAFSAADRIRVAVDKEMIKAYDTTVKVTVSIGITTFPHDGSSVNELIDKADWALYRAKKLGRNRICSFGVYPDDEKI